MIFSKISSKIKFISAILSLIIISIIALTVFINQKNKKDSLVINIAGKQRMLSQKITKELLYAKINNNLNFNELDICAKEFDLNLHSLMNGNEMMGIYPPPTTQISQKLSEVSRIWSMFLENIEKYKKDYTQNYKNLKKDELIERISKDENIQNYLTTVYENSNKLLTAMDQAVWYYTEYSEEKNDFLRNFQYIAALVAIFVVLYSFFIIRNIEEHISSFVKKAKELASSKDILNHQELKIDTFCEEELKEASSHINKFIDKVGDALKHSNDAMTKAEMAIKEIQEIYEETQNAIENLNIDDPQKKQIGINLNNTEDIAIESVENLINVSKLLAKLKNNLQSVDAQYKKK